MAQDYQNLPPVGTPLTEKLQYGVNNAHTFANAVADDFNDLVHIPPDTMATGAAILTGVALYALSKKHNLVGRFVPGGRDNSLHRFVAWSLTVAMAFGAGSWANDAVLNSYGTRTPWNENTQRIKVDPALQGRSAAPQTLYVPQHERQAVNPDKDARVIQINPRVQP